MSGAEAEGPLVLVGLMAAGKTTVARILAEATGRPMLDLDREIERNAGRSIADLFAEHGESDFRRLEASATRAADVDRACIVAAGGGWMANSEARSAWPSATIVWLRVSPREAARRIGSTVADRPVLGTEDVVETLTRTLADRLPAYGQAQYTVDTEGRNPEEIALDVARAVGIRYEDENDSGSQL